MCKVHDRGVLFISLHAALTVDKPKRSDTALKKKTKCRIAEVRVIKTLPSFIQTYFSQKMYGFLLPLSELYMTMPL